MITVYSIIFPTTGDPLIVSHTFEDRDKIEVRDLSNLLYVLGEDLPENYIHVGEIICSYLESVYSDETLGDEMISARSRQFSVITGINYYDRVKKTVRNAKKELIG